MIYRHGPRLIVQSPSKGFFLRFRDWLTEMFRLSAVLAVWRNILSISEPGGNLFEGLCMFCEMQGALDGQIRSVAVHVAANNPSIAHACCLLLVRSNVLCLSI